MVISPYEQLQVLEREREIMILKLGHRRREEHFLLSMAAFALTTLVALMAYLRSGLATGFSVSIVNSSTVAIFVVVVIVIMLSRKTSRSLRSRTEKLVHEIGELESIFRSMVRLLSVNQYKSTEFEKEWDRYLSLVDKKQE